MKVAVLGFDEMNDLYDSDPNFPKMWKEYKLPGLTRQPGEYDAHFIQEGMLFKEFSYVYLEFI